MCIKKLVLFTIAAILLLPNFFDKEVNPLLAYNKTEKFNPGLARLGSIANIENYIDSLAAGKHIAAGSFEYAELMESVISEKFYHGFSHYTLAENWIAALAGKFIKEDYACKVQPEEIMKHPNAACSQQALVMMQLLRNKNMSYRSVGFPHHYAMEILINNEWYFFDANMEPGITKEQRSLSHWQHRSDNLKQLYDARKHTNLEYQFGNNETATTGVMNEVPAQKAKLFHIVTAVLSKTVWMFPLLFLFLRFRVVIRRPYVSFGLAKRKTRIALSA